MSYYEDVYLKRLNRFGTDPQSRIQQQRVKVFEDLLTKSIYRIDFDHEGASHPGLLERYKQDESKIMQYLLTRLTTKLHGGELIRILDQDGRDKTWMVYWLEYIEASGYNRYVLIDTNYVLKWKHEQDIHNPDVAPFESLCYFFGRKQLKKRDDAYYGGGLYLEDTNDYTLIMPLNTNVDKGDYFEIKKNERIYPFRIIGYDVISTDGVMFVTATPVYQYNQDPLIPNPEAVDIDDHTFDWITGNFSEV